MLSSEGSTYHLQVRGYRAFIYVCTWFVESWCQVNSTKHDLVTHFGFVCLSVNQSLNLIII